CSATTTWTSRSRWAAGWPGPCSRSMTPDTRRSPPDRIAAGGEHRAERLARRGLELSDVRERELRRRPRRSALQRAALRALRAGLGDPSAHRGGAQRDLRQRGLLAVALAEHARVRRLPPRRA